MEELIGLVVVLAVIYFAVVALFYVVVTIGALAILAFELPAMGGAMLFGVQEPATAWAILGGVVGGIIGLGAALRQLRQTGPAVVSFTLALVVPVLLGLSGVSGYGGRTHGPRTTTASRSVNPTDSSARPYLISRLPDAWGGIARNRRTGNQYTLSLKILRTDGMENLRGRMYYLLGSGEQIVQQVTGKFDPVSGMLVLTAVDVANAPPNWSKDKLTGQLAKVGERWTIEGTCSDEKGDWGSFEMTPKDGDQAQRDPRDSATVREKIAVTISALEKASHQADVAAFMARVSKSSPSYQAIHADIVSRFRAQQTFALQITNISVEGPKASVQAQLELRVNGEIKSRPVSQQYVLRDGMYLLTSLPF